MAHNGKQRNETFNEVDALRKDVNSMKNLVNDLRDAVELLDTEKDHLRQAVRKLKAENARTKEKLKKLSAHLKTQGGDVCSDDEEFPEYDEIGRDFILIGGSKDPLAIRYEAAILDKAGVEHKTVERYYWAKMAEHFKDLESMKKIIEASDTIKAEETMKDIKNYDEKEWNQVKMKFWEEGQQMKFEQHKWIANILVETGATYIAICHQDKQIGTGWRKNREESNKPLFWDGKNLGGKFLMTLRKDFAKKITCKDDELEEAKQKVSDLRRFVWRRLDRNYRGESSRGRRFSRGQSNRRYVNGNGRQRGIRSNDRRINSVINGNN